MLFVPAPSVLIFLRKEELCLSSTQDYSQECNKHTWTGCLMTRSWKDHVINNAFDPSCQVTDMILGSKNMRKASLASSQIDNGRITLPNCRRRICKFFSLIAPTVMMSRLSRQYGCQQRMPSRVHCGPLSFCIGQLVWRRWIPSAKTTFKSCFRTWRRAELFKWLAQRHFVGVHEGAERYHHEGSSVFDLMIAKRLHERRTVRCIHIT